MTRTIEKIIFPLTALSFVFPATLASVQEPQGSITAVREPQNGAPGALSSDGRYLLFKTDSDSQVARTQLRDLAMWEIATGQTRNIAIHAGTERVGPQPAAVWSPDSDRLAYTWCDGVRDNVSCDVRMVGVDGAGLRIVVPRTNAGIQLHHWSPDGRSILAEVRRNASRRIVLIDEMSGELRDVNIIGQDSDDDINLESPAFSPDGRFIAYTRSRWQETPYNAYLGGDIFVADLAEGEDRLVLGGNASDVFVAWTLDGNAMLFTSDQSGTTDLWMVPVTGGQLRGKPAVVYPRISGITGVGVTRTGGLFFRTTYEESSEVEVAPFDPVSGRVLSAPKPVSSEPTRRRSRPAWSSDGKSLLYRSGPARPVPLFTSDGYNTVSVQSIASGTVREVTLQHECVNAWHHWMVAPLPNSDRWVMSVDGSTAACRGLYSIDAKTGVGSAIESSKVYLEQAAPLKAGKSIVYIRSAQSVVVRDLASGSERLVIDLKSPESGFEGGRFAHLAMAHSSDRAAVLIETRDQRRKLAELDLSSGTLRALPGLELIRGRGWSGLAWTGDDRHLLYIPEPGLGGDVWRIPVQGGGPAPIGLSSPDSKDLITFFSVSPDGKSIVFERQRTRNPALFVLKDFLPRGVSK